MDRIIEVKVGGSYITKDNKNAGVRGEANVTKLRISFDEGWDEYAKTVTFWDARGENPVERILTTDLLENKAESTRVYIVPIPGEPMAIAGEMTFVIDGFYGEFVESENGDYEIAYADKSKRQRSISDKLIVKDAPMTDNAEEPTEPIPKPYEQFQQQIDAIKEDIQDTAKAKEEIENMNVSCETLPPGEDAFAEKVGEEGINLHFGIPSGEKGDQGAVGETGPQGPMGPQGEKGDKGDQGERGLQGVPGADGKDGKDGHTPVKGTDYYTPADKKEIINEISENLTKDIETALDNIIAIQNSLIGGESV